MIKVIENFEKLKLKAQIIEESMIVIPHKLNAAATFNDLSEKNAEVADLQNQIKDSLEYHNEILQKQFKDTTRDMTRVQMKMIYLMQHLEEQEKHQNTQNRALKQIATPGTPKLYEREGAEQAFSELNTPRMPVSDFAKSPYAAKRTKLQFQFTDFEAEISNEEFASVPGYMRGRSSKTEVQDFLDNVVIKTFNDKYRTLHQHRAALKPSEFDRKSMFMSQESYFEGLKFVTVGDVARILEKNVDKKHDRYLQMLRHLHIIREARKGSISCYIWIKN